MATSDVAPGVLSVFLADGTKPGKLLPAVSYPTDSRPRDALPLDVDRDGDMDLVVSSLTGKSELRVLYNTGGGALDAAGFEAYPVGAGSFGLATGDFDGDGKRDVAACNWNEDSVSILLSSGTTPGSLFEPKKDIGNVGWTPSWASVGDFDGDGTLDLVVSIGANNSGMGSGVVLRGLGDGTFVKAQELKLPTGSMAHKVATGDLNGDGRLDVILSNGPTNDVSVFFNTTGCAP